MQDPSRAEETLGRLLLIHPPFPCLTLVSKAFALAFTYGLGVIQGDPYGLGVIDTRSCHDHIHHLPSWVPRWPLLLLASRNPEDLPRPSACLPPARSSSSPTQRFAVEGEDERKRKPTSSFHRNSLQSMLLSALQEPSLIPSPLYSFSHTVAFIPCCYILSSPRSSWGLPSPWCSPSPTSTRAPAFAAVSHSSLQLC